MSALLPVPLCSPYGLLQNVLTIFGRTGSATRQKIGDELSGLFEPCGVPAWDLCVAVRMSVPSAPTSLTKALERAFGQAHDGRAA
jgi:hypothetical protein